MAILHTGLTKPSAGAYDIPYSCRFEDGDSAYLTRTPGSASDRRECTFSFWMKLGNLGIARCVFSNATGGSYETTIGITSSDFLEINAVNSANDVRTLTSNRKLRDPSAWYHIIVSFDVNSGAGDAAKCKVFINGSLEPTTNFSTDQRYAMGGDQPFNNTIPHDIGRFSRSTNKYFDGELAEFHFIDGTQVDDADDFGETGDYGEWKPIEYTGSHGTNGFYLDFADAADLGDDESGNGNDFTETNITTTDQMLDTPTNNFCTWNSIDADDFLLKEGNLNAESGSNAYTGVGSTMGADTGKWYYEVLLNESVGASYVFGWMKASLNIAYSGITGEIYATAGFWGFIENNGNKCGDGAGSASYGSALAQGDIMMIAVDLDNNKIWGGKNGTWFASGNPATPLNEAFSNLPNEPMRPFYGNSTEGKEHTANFGQDATFAGIKSPSPVYNDGKYGSFHYQPPTDYKALCSKNLPDCSVIPSEHFNTVTYTGTGSARSITGVGFQPDLHWLKIRAGEAKSHMLTDSVRGVGKYLQADSHGAELIDAQTVTSFDADGWSFGASGSSNQYNYTDRTYVAWNWKANGAGSANTDGSINSTVSVNATSGFSIVSYTGTGAIATVGHGLGTVPKMIFVKNRSAGDSWTVGSHQLGTKDWTDQLQLENNSAFVDTATPWNDTAPTSSVFTIGTGNNVNRNTSNFIAYLWAEVEGYSKIGSYKGNGSADGPFCFTSFSPSYVILKKVSAAANWRSHTSGNRTPPDINGVGARIEFTTGEETTSTSAYDIDFLSNGFKLRTTSTYPNASGADFIYIAFAETPFKNANAR